MSSLKLVMAASLATLCACAPANYVSMTTGEGTIRFPIEPADATAQENPGAYAVRRLNAPGAEASYALVDGRAVGRLTRGSSVLPTPLPPGFSDTGDAILHSGSGLRLPKTLNDCRLAALAPLRNGDGEVPYTRGAEVEYDCRPATGLTYVLVGFEAPSSYVEERQASAAVEVAHAGSQNDMRTGGSPCQLTDVSAVSGRSGLNAAQCGARWANPANPSAQLQTATLAFSSSRAFIRFTRTCVSDTQCPENTPAFGRFVDSFDLSGLVR